jgi:glycosyltransferase involved in cell wall biosynthesis
MAIQKIAICILTKNAAATLPQTLDSVKRFSEVVILDNGSTDETLEIARGYPNTRCEKTPFIGFGPLRNKAAAHATKDWILALDSDEVLSQPLLEELEKLSLDPKCVYAIPRHNFYRGRRIRGCGWQNEQVVRLYNRSSAAYQTQAVHESIDTSSLRVVELKMPILHTPYSSIGSFLEKMERYTTLFAEERKGKIPSSIYKAIGHGFFAFFRSYFLKRGFLDGKEGFEISLYNGNTAFYKYLKLMEANGRGPQPR